MALLVVVGVVSVAGCTGERETRVDRESGVSVAAAPAASLGRAIGEDFPSALIWAINGDLVFTQDGGRLVTRVDSAANVRWHISREGAGPGEYQIVSGLVALPGDSIGLMDRIRRKYHIWSRTGGIVRDAPFDPMTRPAPIGNERFLGRLSDGRMLLTWSSDAVALARDSVGLDTTFVAIVSPDKPMKMVSVLSVAAVVPSGDMSFYEPLYPTGKVAVCDSGLLHVVGNQMTLRDVNWQPRQRWTMPVPRQSVASLRDKSYLGRHISDQGDLSRISRWLVANLPDGDSVFMAPQIDALGRLWYRTNSVIDKSGASWVLVALNGGEQPATLGRIGETELPSTVIQFGATHAVFWENDRSDSDGSLRLVSLPSFARTHASGRFGRCQPTS